MYPKSPCSQNVSCILSTVAVLLYSEREEEEEEEEEVEEVVEVVEEDEEAMVVIGIIMVAQWVNSEVSE